MNALIYEQILVKISELFLQGDVITPPPKVDLSNVEP